jgi:hypothetical protein
MRIRRCQGFRPPHPRLHHPRLHRLRLRPPIADAMRRNPIMKPRKMINSLRVVRALDCCEGGAQSLLNVASSDHDKMPNLPLLLQRLLGSPFLYLLRCHLMRWYIPMLRTPDLIRLCTHPCRHHRHLNHLWGSCFLYPSWSPSWPPTRRLLIKQRLLRRQRPTRFMFPRNRMHQVYQVLLCSRCQTAAASRSKTVLLLLALALW